MLRTRSVNRVRRCSEPCLVFQPQPAAATPFYSGDFAASSASRAAEETYLYLGGSIGYWRGNITGLLDDIAELRPTMFVGVPRVFDRIYSGVTSKIAEAGGLKAFLFNWGFKRKLHFIEQGHPQHLVRVFD